MEKYLGIYYFCTVNVCATGMTTKILVIAGEIIIHYVLFYSLLSEH